MKAKCPGVFLDFQHLKSGRLKPSRNRVGIDGDERVAYMDHSHSPASPAVTAYKDSSRFKHSPYLSEEPILQCGRRHVVQHGERNDAGELFIGEGQLGRIADYDTNIAAMQTGRECFGQGGVDFDCRQAVHSLSQQVGGETRSGPELQHCVSQLGS
jgi:hypothetical protein